MSLNVLCPCWILWVCVCVCVCVCVGKNAFLFVLFTLLEMFQIGFTDLLAQGELFLEL